jgi:four helix bundle protein
MVGRNVPVASRDLRKRTKQFALGVVRLYHRLPHGAVAQTLGRQLLRSGTSPGAQYREGCRAKSTADFISKVEGAIQELDESIYWMELLVESGTIQIELLEGLHAEADELIAILVTAVKSAKGLH